MCAEAVSKQEKVPAILDWLGERYQRSPVFFDRLSRLETTLLGGDLREIRVEKPVFICGLARSGSTVLLETVARAKGFASHQYRDYPFLLTPVFWETVRKFWPGFDTGERRERAHKDRIMIDSASPEAFEEMIWMHFFPGLHDPDSHAVLDERTSQPDFEQAFPVHLRKMLFLRKGQRYVSKNNYNLTRMGFLLRLFPDAKFIVPVREPVAHVASLLKQHKLFSAVQAQDPAALRYMQRCGHYEFGLDFRPVNTGNAAAVAEIMEHWRAGQYVQAYGIYWREMHAWIVQAQARYGGSMAVVSYEALCSRPQEILSELSAWGDLGLTKEEITLRAGGLSLPGYYIPDMATQEQEHLRRLTADTYEKIQALSFRP